MDNGEALYKNQTIVNRDCYRFPSWVSNVPHMPFVVLQIQMLVIFCITQLLHCLLFKHIGMPPLVSQLLAGLVLGPAGLGRFEVVREFIFPTLNFSVMKCLMLLFYALSLFIVATQMDFTIIKRTSKKIMLIGVLALASALVANTVALHLLNPDENVKKELSIAVTSLPIIAHPVLVRLITDIGLANSELGRLALASGLCAELASIMLTMGMNNILPALGNKKQLLIASLNILGVVALLLTIVFILRPFMRLLIRMTPKDRPVKDTFVLLAFLSMLVGALFTDFVSQFVFLGAFMIGGGLPDGPPLGSALVEKFDSLISGVLHPFFITLAASRIDFSSINFHGKLAQGLVVLITVTTVTKVAVCFICGVHIKIIHQDALSFAFLMCAKGFLEIGTVSWLYDLKAISNESFSVLALHVILMSAFVPLALKLLYDPMRKYGGYQIRDLMHLKQNASLKMVACVLRSEDISSVSNLLRILNPSREAPIVAHVLHLMKLAGRCQPLFISHDMQKKQSSHRYYSDELLWHFDRLQHSNIGALSTHVFTALAHPEAMHEYICTLALDKVASLIILPFHRKFNREGSIDLDDHEQRILNTSVLARSPCSVAVLVDRSYVNIKRPNGPSNTPVLVVPTTEILLSVAVIFIEGADDREALAFAKRMSRGMKIRLTIIRLAAPSDGGYFLNTLDSKAIERTLQAKVDKGSPRIMYLQMTVRDGVETTWTLRSLVQDYDLMIVGRRFGLQCPQTLGLWESSEIKELGDIGDLLASPDLKCRTSILVVQQQKHWS